MGEILDYFKNKRNLVSLLILGILILGIPLGVNLVRLQQIIRSRAAGEPPIKFVGDNVKQKSDGSWVATKPQIQLQLTSPLGPPAGSPGGGNSNTKVYIDPASPIISGSRITMTATGTLECSTSITFDPGQGFNCSTADDSSFKLSCTDANPKNDGNKCWWQKTCTAGTAKSYTATFNASGANCQSSASYTIK